MTSSLDTVYDGGDGRSRGYVVSIGQAYIIGVTINIIYSGFASTQTRTYTF